MSKRTPAGTFAPGTSGNPRGRPQSASAALREQLAVQGESVAAKVVELALQGDVAACRLVLERLAPPLKAQAAPVQVDMPRPENVAEAAAAILKAAAAGEMPPDVAAQLVGAVGTLARVVETAEVRERLEAIETALKEKPR